MLFTVGQTRTSKTTDGSMNRSYKEGELNDRLLFKGAERYQSIVRSVVHRMKLHQVLKGGFLPGIPFLQSSIDR